MPCFVGKSNILIGAIFPMLDNNHFLQMLALHLPISLNEVSYISIFQVIELGGTPTVGDCAMILRAAIKAPMPSAFLTILQTTHSLGYIFGGYVTFLDLIN